MTQYHLLEDLHLPTAICLYVYTSHLYNSIHNISVIWSAGVTGVWEWPVSWHPSGKLQGHIPQHDIQAHYGSQVGAVLLSRSSLCAEVRWWYICQHSGADAGFGTGCALQYCRLMVFQNQKSRSLLATKISRLQVACSMLQVAFVCSRLVVHSTSKSYSCT